MSSQCTFLLPINTELFIYNPLKGVISVTTCLSHSGRRFGKRQQSVFLTVIEDGSWPSFSFQLPLVHVLIRGSRTYNLRGQRNQADGSFGLCVNRHFCSTRPVVELTLKRGLYVINQPQNGEHETQRGNKARSHRLGRRGEQLTSLRKGESTPRYLETTYRQKRCRSIPAPVMAMR